MSNRGLTIVVAIVAVAMLIWVTRLDDENVEHRLGQTTQGQDISIFGDAKIAEESQTAGGRICFSRKPSFANNVVNSA